MAALPRRPDMAVYPYQLANGSTRWFYILDLPPDSDGRRRQRKKRGFINAVAAEKAEREARKTYGGADLNADGTVSAELEAWITERELDVQETTISNYRDVIRCYINHHIGTPQLY